MASMESHAANSQRETLLSVLCTKENWTPNESTAYRSLAFREDGVGCLKLLNDQPGTLLVCEFDWEVTMNDPDKAIADILVDTQQKDLEDSLRTRQLATFYLTIRIRKTKPREEFGDFGALDLEASLARKLKEATFGEEQFFTVVLEKGNFAPDHDTNAPDSEAFGQTRWGLRLCFKDRSPVPALDKWNEEYRNMVESQNWQGETNWFARKVRDRLAGGWRFGAW